MLPRRRIPDFLQVAHQNLMRSSSRACACVTAPPPLLTLLLWRLLGCLRACVCVGGGGGAPRWEARCGFECARVCVRHATMHVCACVWGRPRGCVPPFAGGRFGAYCACGAVCAGGGQARARSVRWGQIGRRVVACVCDLATAAHSRVCGPPLYQPRWRRRRSRTRSPSSWLSRRRRLRRAVRTRPSPARDPTMLRSPAVLLGPATPARDPAMLPPWRRLPAAVCRYAFPGARRVMHY